MIKPLKRSLITHIDPLIRGVIKKDIIPRFGMLVDNMQQQKAIKDNFLNLLSALSWVSRSAVVMLHLNFNVAFCLIANFKRRLHKLFRRFFRVHHNKKG